MCAVYVPNESEKEALKAILLQQAIVVGLYKNQIVPDGNTIFSTLEELTTGATYGYAPKVLTNNVKEGAAAADWWTILVNSAGKASAVYGTTVAPALASLEWTFLAPDVALAPTVYGQFGYTIRLPFTVGLQPIKVGDVIRQGAVCAEVAGVNLTSGSWAAGDAAGYLYLKRQVGTFVAGASLVGVSRETATSEIKVLTAAPVVGGTGYAVGDRFAIGTGTGGVGRVTAVSGGVVTAVELLTGGKDYTVATQATVAIDGAGDNALTVAVASLHTAGPAVVVATLAGDSEKKLVYVEALTTPIAITQLGQKIAVTPTLTMSTG
jgi:hypothetical protein